jgi:hypothetical protein
VGQKRGLGHRPMGDYVPVRRVCVPGMKARKRNRARSEKRRYGDHAKELLACFAEAGNQMGKLSDEAALDVVRCCREKKTKARQSGTKDSQKEVLPRTLR